MPTTYTSLLGLALPATGELAGTWGTTVNDQITSLLDSAIAGTTTINTDADITLTTTTGGANQSRQAIILWTANGTVTRNITAPAASKTYVVINASAGTQSIVIRGVGPTAGVTVLKGERVVVAWNGSDFVKVSSFGGTGAFTDLTVTNTATFSAGTANQVQYLNGSKVLSGSTNLTFDGTALTLGGNPTLSAGTANGVLYLNGSKVATSGSGFTYNGSTLLDVTGSVRASGTLTASYSPSYDQTYISQNGAPGSGCVMATVNYANSAYQPITYDASYYAWRPNGTEGMRLNSTGLGIGTSSPASKLHVSNAAAATRITITDDVANGRSGYIESNFSDALVIGTTSGVRGIRFSPDNTARMFLDTSGNLGIGTSSPARKLHVADAGNTYAAVQRTGATATALVIGAESGNTAIYSWTTPGGSTGVPLVFYTGATEALRLDTSGNLGLGVTPSAWTVRAIQLAGSPALSSVSGADFTYNAFYDGAWKYVATARALRYSQVASNGEHRWFTALSGTAGAAISFSQVMTLDASGNLGLGVTPSAWSQGSAFEVFQNGYGVWNGDRSAYLMANTYFNSGFKYAISGNAASHYYQFQGAHVWSTAPSGTAGNAISFTQAMTLDASGNLGLGVTGPTAKLHIYEPTAAATRIRVLANGGQQAALQLAGNGTTFGTTSFDVFQDGGSDAYVANRANAALQFWTNNTERARITSGGQMVVGNTAAAGSEVFCASNNLANTAPLSSWNRATSGDNYFDGFYTETTATLRGSIDYNRAGGLVRYNTTSDYRAKDIIGPVQNPGAVIDALKVYEGRMKGATQTRPMLVAHEAQEVTPYAVSGVKDEVNEDGTPKFQQIDVSSLVPLLLAELQSLRARVAQLERH